MEYRTLGRTGLQVSRIGYGGAALGDCYTPVETEDGIACVHKAIDEYGINYFDTSPSYGPGGLGETRLGEALAGGWRDKVILATKCGDYCLPDASGQIRYQPEFTSEAVRRELENQLRRLKTDHIDVLQVHDVDKTTVPVVTEELLPEMARLRDEGKVRYLGITSRNLPALREILKRTDLVDVVLTFGRYNLMDISAETFFDDLQAEKGFALLNCSVLYMGMLTRTFLERKHRFMAAYEARPDFPEKFRGFQKAGALCRARGVDLAELALQFGCASPRFDCTLISAGRTARLEQNMRVISEPFDADFAREIYGILKDCSFIPGF